MSPHDIVFYPRQGTGSGSTGEQVQAWITAAWLLAVELRAYLEDLQGGRAQPGMRYVVRSRILELVVQIDAHLAGVTPPDEEHALAFGLEMGLGELARLDGEAVAELFGLAGAIDSRDRDAAVEAFSQCLLEQFPGDLPNPLEPSGQGELLQAMRTWSKLCAEAGIDASFLAPLLQDA